MEVVQDCSARDCGEFVQAMVEIRCGRLLLHGTVEGRCHCVFDAAEMVRTKQKVKAEQGVKKVR